QLIDAVRQTLHIEQTLIVRRQSIVILIRLADDLYRRFHAQTLRISHFKPQFATVALAKKWRGAKEENSEQSLHEESGPLLFSLHPRKVDRLRLRIITPAWGDDALFGPSTLK